MLVHHDHPKLGPFSWLTPESHDQAFKGLDAKSQAELEVWMKEMTLLHMTTLTAAALILKRTDRMAYMKHVSNQYLLLCKLAQQKAQERADDKREVDPLELLRQTHTRRSK